jgi:trimethylamine:corrinoid methyltransferase-like protein
LTLDLFRNAYYNSTVFPKLTLESWQAQGRPSAEGVLRRTTQDLLAHTNAPEDHAELMARGQAFIDSNGAAAVTDL